MPSAATYREEGPRTEAVEIRDIKQRLSARFAQTDALCSDSVA